MRQVQWSILQSLESLLEKTPPLNTLKFEQKLQRDQLEMVALSEFKSPESAVGVLHGNVLRVNQCTSAINVEVSFLTTQYAIVHLF